MIVILEIEKETDNDEEIYNNKEEELKKIK